MAPESEKQPDIKILLKPELVKRIRRIPRIAALSSISIGLLGLIGWIFGIIREDFPEPAQEYIERLESELDKARQEIEKLKGELLMNSRNSSKPDAVVHHALKQCQGCKEDLTATQSLGT